MLTGGSASRAPSCSIPINHFEGNYTCDAATLAMLRAEDRVVLRYVDNPNGSVDDIAGVCNEARNVVGLMPHPERASDPLLGSVDGVVLLAALVRQLAAGRRHRGLIAVARRLGVRRPGRRPDRALSCGCGESWPAAGPRRSPRPSARPSTRCPCARRRGRATLTKLFSSAAMSTVSPAVGELGLEALLLLDQVEP